MFIVRVIVERRICNSSNRVFFLVSGRPISLYELIHNVELITGKRMFCSFSLFKKNSLSTTFSASLLPKGFSTSPFDVALRKVYLSLTK